MTQHGISPVDQTLYQSENGPEIGINMNCYYLYYIYIILLL